MPGQEPRRFISLTQAGLDEYLRLKGAEGFDAGGGNVSRLLADLPDGGTVDLVLPAELPLEMQVRPWLACRPALHSADLPAMWLVGLVCCPAFQTGHE